MNYSSLQGSASKLIKQFGRVYTFTRTTAGAYDPATGKTTDTTTTFTKSACTFDYSDADRADGTILQGDRRVLAEGYAYQVGDKIAIDGDSYKVISITNIQPAGTVVAANLQVRK